MALSFPLNPTVGALYQTGSSATYEFTNKNYWEVIMPSPLEIINAQTAISASFAVSASFLPGAILNYPDPFTSSAPVSNIISLTEAEFTALDPKVSSTLYLIV